ncbi:hypothetical protein BHU72_04435 [Desulfuribacillus stibiiarsenatis]|uniref:DUF4276 domain-containing protein n=1 Tax=Desulfuribacillus stibiiarsenatis TaxID=1390249 RepID=A0A1E5L5F8_9FIRM|nr:DUF4276 family protein [Desulfuribacillus stibiiarsenatis]OEH85346.1 hypothetical protein BHU72_04435 [Desulfuribacillus stibiiarsenatis]
MKRLNIIVEGQTEETFVRDLLAAHLGLHGIDVRARMVETSRRDGKIFRGGLASYEKLKRDLLNWMDEDKTAWYTTMIDFYALPKDFPGYHFINIYNNPYNLVKRIERAIAKDIRRPFFIPYIQLHEFEALILTDPLKFDVYFFKRQEQINNLKQMTIHFPSPEHINHGVATAPSKRIINEIPAYRYSKRTAGPMIAAEIGLPMIRQHCKHFDQWLHRLERIL